MLISRAIHIENENVNLVKGAPETALDSWSAYEHPSALYAIIKLFSQGMKRYYILLLSLFLSLSYNFSQINTDLEKSSIETYEDILTSKKAIAFIQYDRVDSLKQMVPPDVLALTKEENLITILNDCKILLNNSLYPKDSQIIIKYSTIFRNGKKIQISKLSFPFININIPDSIRYINISVSDNLAYSLGVNDFPYGFHFVEPKYTEPHLSTHKLDYNSINWFRIWYESGFKDNEYGDSYGYYAVSGDKNKLDKIGIKNLVSDLFTLINNSKIDSTDIKYIDDDPSGNGEFIRLRFKFNNLPYSKFGECTILSILEDEPGKNSIFRDYIIFKHSEKTRYLYSKSSNPELVAKLSELAYREYGKFQESRFH